MPPFLFHFILLMNSNYIFPDLGRWICYWPTATGRFQFSLRPIILSFSFFLSHHHRIFVSHEILILIPSRHPHLNFFKYIFNLRFYYVIKILIHFNSKFLKANKCNYFKVKFSYISNVFFNLH